MRKITFQVIVADRFIYPEDDGTNTHLWPIPDGKSNDLIIDLEFEPSGGDVMRDAESELDKYIKENYPNRKHKIYYWWWRD